VVLTVAATGSGLGKGGQVPKPRKVTLTDVAQHARVSATTASYILNGRSVEMRIASDTEARVRIAAAELGYRPNRAARSLRTKRTATVGLISDFIAGGHFSSQLLTGACAAARASDHLVVIGETGGDLDVEDLLIDEMLDRQVDGVIVATRTALRITVNPRLAGVNTVLLNCIDLTSQVPAVLPDDLTGGSTAAGLLLDAGLEDGIWVVGEDPVPNAVAGSLRLAGVHARLAEDDLTLAGVVPCDWEVVPAYDAMSAWLASGARPRGLICLNDRIAMGAYQALAEHGLDVPGDVSVVSFDASDLATWLRPRVTSLELSFAELGARAVDLLLTDPVVGTVVRLPMPVRPGESVR
jgi:LacI family transcriptional regulator